jgi:prolyl oligopeptidase PreP (S9A serine peptidase family)
MELEEEKKQNEGEITNRVVSTKDELIFNIKEWIKMDNELTKLKQEIKDKTNKKKDLTQTLVNVMKNNAIDCFDINGGALIYKQKKTKKTISGKYLLAQLEAYYKDKPEVAKELTKMVLDNREEVVKEEIKRKIDK